VPPLVPTLPVDYTQNKALVARKQAIMREAIRTARPGARLQLTKAIVFHKAVLNSGMQFSRRRTAQRFVRPDGNASMVGHDFVGTLEITDTAEAGDLVFGLSINPVDLGFPALTVETQLHQQYLFRQFAIHMVNTVGAFINGDVLGWFDRDPDEIIPEGDAAIQIGYYKGGSSGAFKKGHTWHMPHYPDLPLLYCRDISSDQRLVNQAEFNMNIINPPSLYTTTAEATAVALNVEIWASYLCEFRVKDITQLILQQPPVAAVANVPNPSQSLNVSEYNPLGQNGPASSHWEALSGSNTAGLVGLFFGYSVTAVGSFVGMLAGSPFSNISELVIECEGGNTNDYKVWGAGIMDGAYTLGCTVTNEFWQPASTSTTTVGAMSRGSVTVTVPGSVNGTMGSDFGGGGVTDNIYYIDPQGQVKPYPYNAADEVLWGVYLQGSSATYTSTLPYNMRVFPVTYAIGGAALTYGPATVEGRCMTRWKEMSNAQRREYKGVFKEFVREVKMALKPKKPDISPELEEALRGLRSPLIRQPLISDYIYETKVKQKSDHKELVAVEPDSPVELVEIQRPVTPALSQKGSFKGRKAGADKTAL